MIAAELTARLARIATEIQLHGVAIWELQDERQQLQRRLRASNQVPADDPTTAAPGAEATA